MKMIKLDTGTYNWDTRYEVLKVTFKMVGLVLFLYMAGNIITDNVTLTLYGEIIFQSIGVISIYMFALDDFIKKKITEKIHKKIKTYVTITYYFYIAIIVMFKIFNIGVF